MREALARWWREPEPWTLLVWLLPPATVLLALMPTGDLAYQIRVGLRMIDDRSILTHDVFTYTMGGQPWLNQQWAAELTLGGLFRLVGWRGLVVVRAVLAGVAAGVTLNRTRARGADPFVAGVLVLVALEIAFLLPGTAALRPQLLSVPLFLLTLWLLDTRREHPTRPLWLVPVAIAWANVHGSFVLVPALAGISFVADLVARHSRDAIRSGALTVATLLTPLVSPLGVGTYRYLGELLTSPLVRDIIDEWQPLWRRWPAFPAFVAMSTVLLAVLWQRRTRNPTLEEALRATMFTILAVWSGRHLLWWALAMPPIAGGMLAGWHPERGSTRTATVGVAAVLAVVLGIGVVRVATTRPVERLLTEIPTREMTETVRTASANGARVFDGWWGSWFELEMPGVPMFVDARAELFTDEIWGDWFTITQARPGWREAIDRWNIDVVVANERYQGRLIGLLRSDAAWMLLHEDDEGAVFIRA
jgi:hypothetical protein